jgi:putative transposase
MNFVLQPWQLLLTILGAANRLINAGAEVGRSIGQVHCRERLGGVLRYYYRSAA